MPNWIPIRVNQRLQEEVHLRFYVDESGEEKSFAYVV